MLNEVEVVCTKNIREKNVPCSILNEVAVHTKSYKEGNFYKYVPCVHTLKY